MTTRQVAPMHVALDRRDHRADRQCECRPIEAHDLAEPSRLVVVHRWPDKPTPPTTNEDGDGGRLIRDQLARRDLRRLSPVTATLSLADTIAGLADAERRERMAAATAAMALDTRPSPDEPMGASPCPR